MARYDRTTPGIRSGWAARVVAAGLSVANLAGCHRDGPAPTKQALTGIITAAPQFLDQGQHWDDARRQAFYTQDQGSQMIPLAWLQALKTDQGAPFLGDHLARYGYLPNPANAAGLPIGFTVAGSGGNRVAGMNCAACHTRQITVGGTDYRIDGGPALSDFQALLTDQVAAVGRVLASDAAFTAFADDVLGKNADAGTRQRLRAAVDLWHGREQAMVDKALPHADMWGLGRLDAVSMIFNRLSGLDIGPPPSYLIKANIQPADAPVRYPFVWNAPRQDKTQWPGFADNGDNLLGLARNLGEVYGVFAVMHPIKSAVWPSGTDLQRINSANFAGLARLENLIAAIGAPRYPWHVDAALAARGKTLFNAQCAGCHLRDGHEDAGTPRLFNPATWKTRIQDVGTDNREYSILSRTANSGVLAGGKLLIFDKPIQPDDKIFTLLGFSVISSILEGGLLKAGPALAPIDPLHVDLPKYEFALKGAFSYPEANGAFRYEARVLKGIWATAPYLHDGSVPTLADLLKPAKDRPASFRIGRNYDIARLGLAADQPGSSYTRTVSDCADRGSGNSRCGHEGPGFGTDLPARDKTALLEYLKTL